MKLLKKYTQSGCQFECMLEHSRDHCQCTPWNFPFEDVVSSKAEIQNFSRPTICDNARTTCFLNEMQNARYQDCNWVT